MSTTANQCITYHRIAAMLLGNCMIVNAILSAIPMEELAEEAMGSVPIFLQS
jgi:hypothetical protein